MKIIHGFRCAALIGCGFFAMTHTLPVWAAAKWDPSAKDPASSGSKQGAGAPQQVPPPGQGYFKKKKKATEPQGGAITAIKTGEQGQELIKLCSFPGGSYGTVKACFATKLPSGGSGVETGVEGEGYAVSENCKGQATCPATSFCIDGKSGGELSGLLKPGEAMCAILASKVTCSNANHLQATVKFSGKAIPASGACNQNAQYCVDGACTSEAPLCVDTDQSKAVIFNVDQVDQNTVQLELFPEDESYKVAAGLIAPDGSSLGKDVCKSGDLLLEKVCYEGKPENLFVSCPAMGSGLACVKGKCVVDFCPKIGGEQASYLYDTDGDKVNDSCDPPQSADKCPTVAGVQTEFLHDTTGDGIKDSCHIFDSNTCKDPEPGKSYPEATVYAYGKELHLGLCTNPKGDGTGQILHFICNDKGKTITDITSCTTGFDCVQGKCSLCQDLDGGVNWDVLAGALWISGGNTVKKSSDACNWYQNTIVEYYCDDDTVASVEQGCPVGTKCTVLAADATIKCLPPKGGSGDGDSDDECTSKNAVICKDGDGGNNLEVVSFVQECCISLTGFGGEVGEVCPSELEHDDGCFSAQSIAEVVCNGSSAELKLVPCPSETHCKHDKNSIQCVPDLPSTCQEGDNGIDLEKKSVTTGTIYDGTAETVTDGCWNGNVIEGYCEFDQVKTYTVECTAYQHCVNKDGEAPYCADNCFDDDPLNTPLVQGIVTDSNKTPHPDFCDGNQLKQFACDPQTNEMITVPPVTCPNVCANGACVP